MDPIMMTQLTTDLCRVLKTNLVRFDNDASACYDRIIVALGMLAARRCGMPENAILSHAKSLEFMRYTVKTFYGVSYDNYHGTSFEPLFGTGQGSGASPAVWLSLVVLLLHTLDKVIPERMTFQSPDKSVTSSRLADAFVDDTYLGFTDAEGQMEYDNLIRRLQEVAQTWSHLLHLSGGKLNLSKCTWYIMYWEWVSGRPRLRPIAHTDPPIELNSAESGLTTTIKQVPLDKSARILGVHLNPLGTFSDHIKFLKSKADTFAVRLRSPRITPSDVMTFHRSIYVPMLRYSLAAIAADSEESLHQIQTKIIPSMLQKLQVSSKLPTSIRHGPIEYGGMELYDVRTEAGIEQIKYLRNAIYSGSATGTMIRINLHHSQLEAGVGQPLLENPSYEIPYLTPCWILSLRKFLATHNATITITDQPQLSLKTDSDAFIMQQSHLARYSTAHQRDLNLVRMYLQVTSLADLTDPGRLSAIHTDFLNGRRPPHWKTHHIWPRQEAPSAHQRRLWKRYITSSFLRYIPFWKTPPTSSTPSTPTGERPTSKKVEMAPTSFPTIRDYLATLSRTQRRLVEDVTQVATDLQVWRAFRSRERLYIASDGGLSGNEGTFGWVISTRKFPLFQCGGPVDGPFDTNSSTKRTRGLRFFSSVYNRACALLGIETQKPFQVDYR
ncbi:hypothetical protein MHU86_818 [Fragilaria crotonensis]|nr:hypothetical protein MHU86_818 [Fragilaria crotonensis]